MKPPFSYYGGKIGLAPTIAAMLPPHRVYLEPYFGSGAVLLAKPPSTHEIVNDINAALVTFWRVLRDRPDDLTRVCALTPFARDEYELAANLTENGLDDLEVARRWWIRVNQGFAKTGADRTGWCTTTGRNASVTGTIFSRLGRIGPVARRLANVSIENCDAVDMIERFATSNDTVVYCDPPYLGETRTTAGRRTNGDYLHEMMDTDSHRQLAEALHATPANVVLSGYHSRLYVDLYRGWRRVEHTVTAHSSNAARRTTRDTRVEVLWANFDGPEQLTLAV